MSLITKQSYYFAVQLVYSESPSFYKLSSTISLVAFQINVFFCVDGKRVKKKIEKKTKPLTPQQRCVAVLIVRCNVSGPLARRCGLLLPQLTPSCSTPVSSEGQRPSLRSLRAGRHLALHGAQRGAATGHARVRRGCPRWRSPAWDSDIRKSADKKKRAVTKNTARKPSGLRTMQLATTVKGET